MPDSIQTGITIQELDAKIAALREAREKKTVEKEDIWWTAQNAMTISSAVLVFGVFTMIIALTMVKRGTNPEAALRILGTLVILFAALFLVVAGYSDKQIAPVMGLLGTIAGYLLGKTTKES